MMSHSPRTWRVFLWQCRIVLASWFWRPANWGFLFVGMVVGLLLTAGIGRSFDKGTLILAGIPRPMYSYENLKGREVQDFKLFLARRPAEEVRSLVLPLTRFNRLPPGDKLLLPPELNQLVNLQALQLRGLGRLEALPSFKPAPLEAQDFELLKHARALNHLELSDCPLAPGTLSEIGRQHSLRHLVADAVTLGEHLDELPACGNLTHLQLENMAFTPELIDVVLKIPRLKILTLKQTAASSVSREELLRLKQHPALRWVFADWSQVTVNEEQLQAEMIPLKALPVSVPKTTMKPTLALWIAMFATILVTFNLQGQFLRPDAMLLPGFSGPHLVPAFLLTILSLALSLSIITRATLYQPLPATVLLLLYSALIAGSFLLSCRFTGLGNTLMILTLAMGFQLVMQIPGILSTMAGASLYWFITGKQPALAVVLLVVEVFLIGLALRKLCELPRVFAEGSPVAPVLTTGEAVHQYVSRPVPNYSSWGVVQPQGLEWHGGVAARRRALLQAGMNLQPQRIVLWGFPLLGVAILILSAWGVPEEALLPIAATGVGLVSGWVPLLTLQGWNMRTPMLGEESLRPVKRSEFAQDLFLTFLRGCWPILIPLFMILLLGLWRGEPIGKIVGLFLLLAGLLSFLLSLGFTLFALPRRWWTAAVSLFPMALLMQVLILGPMLMVSTTGFPSADGWLASAGLVLLGSAVLLSWRLYRQTAEREWGMT